MKVEYNDGQKRVMDEMLAEMPGVRAGKMFGFPGYYAGGKLFACVFGPGVALKLTPARAEELLGKPGFSAFLPLGRRMKAWVMVERKRPADLRRLEPLFLESLGHVAGLRMAARKRKG